MKNERVLLAVFGQAMIALDVMTSLQASLRWYLIRIFTNT
jgi:hypothetical protein